MFSSDRHLLALEPTLFRDAAWLGQRLLACVGSVAGTTLTIVPVDADFESIHLGAGHVAGVDGVAYEVVERLSATTATISRLRPDPGGPLLPPAAEVGRPVSVVTFAPQIAAVHAQVLRMIGVGPAGEGPLTESSITNPGDLAMLESLGALHLILTAAAALTTPGSFLWTRAEMYRARFAAERQRAAAQIDLDGDGRPDATRRLTAVHFTRL